MIAALCLLLFTFSPARGNPGPAATGTEELNIRDGKLWTRLGQKKKRSKTSLPSLAPLADKAQRALLVVLTRQESGTRGHTLPPGHPPLPAKHPPVIGQNHAHKETGQWMSEDGYGAVAHPFGGQGSGFLIHPSGLALTNHHVVEHASDLRVQVGGQPDTLPAKIIGVDAKSDVALLRIQSPRKDWPTLPLGDSDALRVGDFVVSLGAPFGLVRSVSLGLVSGRGRHDVHPDGRSGFYDFLQTDVGLHAGNSGGPLLNLDGEVIGINTAVNAHSEKIGFSVPINLVKRLLPAIFRDGRVTRAWMGVGFQALSPELARAFGRTNDQGALIHDVMKGGPADKSGLIAGDIVLRLGEHPIARAHELAMWAGESPVGQELKMEIWRDNQMQTLTIRLDPHPDNADPPELSENSPAVIDAQKGDDVGLRVVTLNRNDRNELALPPELEGARVVDVRLGSPAFLAGIRPDDVVIEVEGTDISDAGMLASQISGSEAGRMMRVRLWRSGQSIYVALEKP